MNAKPKEPVCDYYGRPISQVQTACSKSDACQFCMAFQTPEEKALVDAWESQDDYCRGCVHADSCNVMLKDGEECGDRYEITAVELTPAGRKARIEADEEAADFDAQVRETLAHWPGIEAIELTEDQVIAGLVDDGPAVELTQEEAADLGIIPEATQAHPDGDERLPWEHYGD